MINPRVRSATNGLEVEKTMMKRYVWLTALMFLAGMSLSGISPAQEKYPSQPIKIAVALGPGSGADALARVMAEYLRRDLQTEVIVENKPGAGGIVGGEFLAKAAPDGYTLGLFHASVVTAVPAITQNLPYDPIRDFTPISTLVTNPLALVVNSSSKWNTLEELLADAKKAPGKISCGIIGVGSHTHFNMELLKIASGANINRAPYSRGSGPIITDLLGGHIDCPSLVWPAVLGQIKAGKFRALAVTSRIKGYPNVPTFASKGYPQASLEVFFALFGPANLPQEVMDRLVPAIAKEIKNPEVEAKLEKMGFEILYEGPKQLGTRVRNELALLKDLAKKTGVKRE